MAEVQDTYICPKCGEEVWYEFNYRTGEETILSQCKCDVRLNVALELIEEHGLKGEYEERLKEYEAQ